MDTNPFITHTANLTFPRPNDLSGSIVNRKLVSAEGARLPGGDLKCCTVLSNFNYINKLISNIAFKAIYDH